MNKTQNERHGWIWKAGVLCISIVLIFACSIGTVVSQNPVDGAQGSARSVNSYAPAYPFPQAVTYPGTIKPNHKSQEQLNQDVLDYFNYWKTTYVKESNGGTPGGGYYVKADSTGGHTYPIKSNSEAHGYGMIAFALMADKEYFDGMYNMYDKHRSIINNNLMSWVITYEELASQDSDSATDGDMDIAYSLLIAHKQWGSDGPINYLAEAKRIITDGIKVSDVSETTLRVLMGDWQKPHAQYDEWGSRPSDWMTGHFQSYYEATSDPFWLNVKAEIYSLVDHITVNYSPDTGLMPDFVIKSPAEPANEGYLEGSHDDEYYYNACRYPWRIAVDYAHNQSPEALDALSTLMAWMYEDSKQDPYYNPPGGNPPHPKRIKAGYSLDGTFIGGYQDSSFIAPVISACIINSEYQDLLNEGFDYIAGRRSAYYPDSITLLNMLFISGNWWDPTGDLTPDTENPTKPGQPTADNLTHNSVDLSWSASSDNIMVSSYKIYQDGEIVTSVNGSSTTVSISGLNSETAYSFTVKAFDPSGNSSSESSSLSVVTLPYIGNIYTITASSGDYGSISPSGAFEVEEGENQSFSITANEGYVIEDVLVNDQSVGAVNNYTIQDIQDDHTITVSFKEESTDGLDIIYDISYDWGSGTSIVLTVTNTSNEPISNWTCSWTFNGNQNITSMWSADFVQTGQTVDITPASWTQTIGAGESINFGFNANYSGSNIAPEDINFNY